MGINMSNKDVVIPGEILGVIEEYAPSMNCFEHENTIYSTVYGEKVIDKENKQVSVIPKRQIFTPKRGSIALGFVSEIRRQNAFIEISFFKVGKSFIDVKTKYKANLSITNLSNRYVKYMYDGVRPGDWIIAKIIKVEFNGNMSVSMYGSRDLGVIYASCFVCGQEISKSIKRDLIRCQHCGTTQSRVLSSECPLSKSR